MWGPHIHMSLRATAVRDMFIGQLARLSRTPTTSLKSPRTNALSVRPDGPIPIHNGSTVTDYNCCGVGQMYSELLVLLILRRI
jgi:hypothetical protein